MCSAPTARAGAKSRMASTECTRQVDQRGCTEAVIRNAEHSRSMGDAATPVVRMAMKTISAELDETFIVYLSAVSEGSCLQCLPSSPTL